MRYVKATTDYGLVYVCGKPIDLTGYIDIDWLVVQTINQWLCIWFGQQHGELAKQETTNNGIIKYGSRVLWSCVGRM